MGPIHTESAQVNTAAAVREERKIKKYENINLPVEASTSFIPLVFALQD